MEGRGQGRRAVVICQSVGLSLSQRQAEVFFFFFLVFKAGYNYAVHRGRKKKTCRFAH